MVLICVVDNPPLIGRCLPFEWDMDHNRSQPLKIPVFPDVSCSLHPGGTIRSPCGGCSMPHRGGRSLDAGGFQRAGSVADVADVADVSGSRPSGTWFSPSCAATDALAPSMCMYVLGCAFMRIWKWLFAQPSLVQHPTPLNYLQWSRKSEWLSMLGEPLNSKVLYIVMFVAENTLSVASISYFLAWSLPSTVRLFKSAPPGFAAQHPCAIWSGAVMPGHLGLILIGP